MFIGIKGQPAEINNKKALFHFDAVLTNIDLMTLSPVSPLRPPPLLPERSAMFTEVLVALAIGGLIFFLVQKSRTPVLKTEDGWWGAGAPPDGVEDISIRPFKVTTSDEELEVRPPQ